MNIQKLAAASLRPAPYNPRKDLKPKDAEYQKIKKSIETFGYVDPIIVNSDLTVIGGHQRLKVLKDLGYKEVECVVVNLGKEQEKALNVALNKIGGEWEKESLKNLLEELMQTDLDMGLTGFSADELDALLGQTRNVTDDEFDLEQAEKDITDPITLPGDLWFLGRHRLLCGDATKASDLERLMDGEQAELVLTDPPYNVDYEGATKDALKIMNDKMSNDQFYRFLHDFYSATLTVTKPGGAVYVFHADSEGANFRSAMKDSGWLLKQCLIWVKSALVLGRQDYQWKHEPILYGWKPGAAHRWYGGFSETTTIDYEKPVRNGDHPTMKPVGLVAKLMVNSSKKDDPVLDCFGGSGTTLIAAEQTERRAFLLELDPKYCDVIVRRWEELTGKQAERVSADAKTTGGTGEQQEASDERRKAETAQQ